MPKTPANPHPQKETSKMSQERVLESIMQLGLTEADAQVYVYLALNGPQKAKQITQKMNLYKEQLYRSLKKLQKKDIVESTDEHPAVYSAIPFEKALDLLAEIKKEQEKALLESRKELLASWKEMTEKNSKNN